jgi:threonine/homoserine/homoserine lactone efflux protein
MIDCLLFLRGLAIGFVLAAPVGPVGLLCIRRALQVGREAALVAGLGAALGDTIFGAVAGLGLTMVSSFLLNHQLLIRLVGGCFLILLGLKSWRDSDRPACAEGNGGGLLKDACSTFLLTLSNPATILAAVGVFAALGAIGLDDPMSASLLIIGVFFGSTLWWVLLTSVASAMRSRFSADRLRVLNHITAGLLSLTGGGILATLLIGYLRR